MNIVVAAVGKAKASPEMALFSEYQKRLKWKLSLKELDGKKFSGKAQETEALLAACAGSQRIIALDEQGKSLSSEAFAAQIAKWQQQGVSSLGFIIGGADGLDRAHMRADLTLSFGSATWPHMLVRAMLAEQLYRAQSLLAGHPYHRS